jgi:hypothetical protein
MVLTLNKNSTKKQIALIEKKLRSNNKSGFNAKKYCGVINFKEDGLSIQKQLRDEWERDFS